jgi:oligopeptide/dipeptide ABC transporter ATP-binding protein
MLDVSIKAEILTLIRSLVEKRGLAFLYISHDLAVLSQVSDIIAIMYLGKIVEMGKPKDVIGNPLHPYTEALINAIPVPDPRFTPKTVALKGDITSAVHIMENQCRFLDRCPIATKRCNQESPPDVVGNKDSHQASCFNVT